MKRAHNSAGPSDGGTGATPKNNIPKPQQRSTKRPRQTTLHAFLTTTTPGDTPGSVAHMLNSGAAAAWPSTAQRALEQFRLDSPAGQLDNDRGAQLRGRTPSMGGQGPHPAATSNLAPTSQHARQPSSVLTGQGRRNFSPLQSPVALGRNNSQYEDYGDDGDDDDGGFRITCSQTYNRPATQQLPVGEEEEDGSVNLWTENEVPSINTVVRKEDQLEQQHQLIDLTADATQEQPFEQEVCSQHMRLTPEQPDEASAWHAGYECAARLDDSQAASFTALNGRELPQQRAGGAPRGAQAVTPELAPAAEAAAGPAVAQGHGGARVASLFRPKSERKLLIVVRHGESEYNRAVNESRTFADPCIYDPHLTPKGIHQCKALKLKLAGLLAENCPKLGEALWVVSPLTRALQTFMLACPCPERMPCPVSLRAMHLPFSFNEAGMAHPNPPAGHFAAVLSGGAFSEGLHVPVGPGGDRLFSRGSGVLPLLGTVGSFSGGIPPVSRSGSHAHLTLLQDLADQDSNCSTQQLLPSMGSGVAGSCSIGSGALPTSAATPHLNPFAHAGRRGDQRPPLAPLAPSASGQLDWCSSKQSIVQGLENSFTSSNTAFSGLMTGGGEVGRRVLGALGNGQEPGFPAADLRDRTSNSGMGPQPVAMEGKARSVGERGKARAVGERVGSCDDMAGGVGATGERVGSSHFPVVSPIKIEVLPSIAEFGVTTGEVGRPAANLIKDFPQLEVQLSRLREAWWHHNPKQPLPSCALTKRWGGAEPKDSRKSRVEEFSRWLSAREERLFVLVGHSCFWDTFMGKAHPRMANCEVLCIHF